MHYVILSIKRLLYCIDQSHQWRAAIGSDNLAVSCPLGIALTVHSLTGKPVCCGSYDGVNTIPE